MNPLTQNPFEVADRAGLHLAKRAISLACRHWNISPVLSRHMPRIIFALGFTAAAVIGPAEKALILPFAALFLIVAATRVLPDVPSMRIPWNAGLYRTYGAAALREREVRRHRWISIALMAGIVTISAALLTSFGSRIAIAVACFLALQASMIFGQWTEAAELPEPDEGDFFASPHLSRQE